MYYLFKFLKLIFYWSCGFGIYLWTLDFSFMKDQQSIKVLTFIKVKVKVAQSCLTLCNPMDYTVHGILQARILQGVAFPFSRGIFPTQGLKPGLPLSFPDGSEVKVSACNAGDLGSIPGLGRFPWRRERPPAPVFWPGEFHGLYSPWGCKESDMTFTITFIYLR